MDELDRRIRRIATALQVNGRASWLQVARVVGSSESTVARRAQQMIDAGRIPVIAIAEPIKCGLGYPVLDPLIAVPENASDKSYVLDAVDLRLYVLLLEDGLRCFSELASLVSMSDLMARRRIDALRERGCLRFATLFEHYLLRYDVECVCGYVSNSRNSRGQEGPSPIDKKCVTFPP